MNHWEMNDLNLAPSREFVSRNLVVHGHDLDKARHAVARMFVDHRLDTKMRKGNRPVTVSCHSFHSLKLCYFDYGREILISPDQLVDFYLLLIPLSGKFRIRCGSCDVTIGPGEAAVLPPDRDFDMNWSADATQMTVRIDIRRMKDCVEAALGQAITRMPEFALKVDWKSPMLSPLRGAVASLAGAIGHFGLAGFDMVSKSIEDALILSLLYHHQNCLSQALTDGRLSPACPKMVRRAEAFIEANLAQPFGVEDIVKASGGSARTLYASFNRFRDMSPMQFVRFKRLHRTRKELDGPDEQTSVGAVASNWGFEHKGRFAREYARLFGETPSRTLSRARNRIA